MTEAEQVIEVDIEKNIKELAASMSSGQEGAEGIISNILYQGALLGLSASLAAVSKDVVTGESIEIDKLYRKLSKLHDESMDTLKREEGELE